jgi:hypothetical protein
MLDGILNVGWHFDFFAPPLRLFVAVVAAHFDAIAVLHPSLGLMLTRMVVGRRLFGVHAGSR